MTALTLPRAHFVDVDITGAAHKANPHPLYAKLRADAPVCEVAMPDGQTAWLVTRYDDVVSVLKDPRFVKDRFPVLSPDQLKKQPWVPPIFKPLMSNMLDNDPPNHTRLRALVQTAFTPRRIEAMRGRIQVVTDDLLESVPANRPSDLIADFALPLPSIVIAEILGIPAGDRHKFHRWSNALVSVNWSKWAILRGIPAGWQLIRYARKLIAKRRARPAEDLISALVQARENGDALSEDELVAMIILLLIAGHETTVNLIGNGMLSLLEHPQELQKLRDNPALIVSAVEELLRFSSPLDTATERFAADEVTVAGVTIPRGSLVFAAISSANRDESQFADPDQLDITREPNRHLSFGQGIHFCIGAPLARAEAQIAINTLLRRAPNLRLAVPPEKLKWRQGLVLRGIKALPVIFAGSERISTE